jgi:hypothetical protein
LTQLYAERISRIEAEISQPLPAANIESIRLNSDPVLVYSSPARRAPHA